MSVTVLCYAKCTTCQKALKWLNERGVAYVERPIREENPGEEELRSLIARSGLPIRRFFNTSGMAYRALGLKDALAAMPEEEQLRLLASDGMLVKRPLLVSEKGVYPGFKESEWEKLV